MPSSTRTAISVPSEGADTAGAAEIVAGLNNIENAAIASLLAGEIHGLQILRSAWINLDTIWAIALIAAGFMSLIV